jgi:hypothetical protein
VATKVLPCPHCSRPIAIALRQFFPSRRYPIGCGFCGGLARLAWDTVVLGVGALVLSLMVALMLIDMSGLPKADTWPTILLYGLALFVGVAAVTHLVCRICRFQSHKLDKA